MSDVMKLQLYDEDGGECGTFKCKRFNIDSKWSISKETYSKNKRYLRVRLDGDKSWQSRVLVGASASNVIEIYSGR
jgi:hypothetical protein